MDKPKKSEVFSRPDDSPYSQELSGLSNTEEVLHEVGWTSENNQPFEKLLELRHEVKDSVSKKPHAGPNISSIGQVLESRGHEYAMPQRSTKTSNYKKSGVLNQAITGKTLYGLAIRYGFVSALLALVTAILAVTLFT